MAGMRSRGPRERGCHRHTAWSVPGHGRHV